MTLIELAELEGMVFTKRGSRYWSKCIFHSDDTPSFSISQKDNGYVWHCFSCKRGGGPVSFLAEIRDIPEFEAKREWAKINGIQAPDGDRELLTSIVESLPAHEYLINRGITEETQKKFHVGYCTDYKALLKKFNVDENTAEDLGLFDLTGRIVYPFYDKDGVYKISSRPIGIKDYKSSAENARFFKRGLWGWQLVRGTEVYIFEGQHDCMVAKQAGYQALAAGGTEITSEGWAELKANGIERIILVPDGDAGGKGWLERMARKAPSWISLEFIVLQSGDPDDAILNGSFQTLHRVNPFEWYVTNKWGSPISLADRCRMLQDSKEIYTRMSPVDKAVARTWYRDMFGDDESLMYLSTDISQDVESERVVIANCLYSTTARIESLQILDETCFTGELHRRAFSLIRSVEATPQLMLVEIGVDYSDFVDLLNFRRYIDKVSSIGLARKVNETIRNSDPFNPGETIEKLYKITDKTVTIDGVSLVKDTLNVISNRVDNPDVLGIEIKNFPIMNKTLLGWCEGRLILISGNSGHGKTTLAMNFVNDFIDEYPAIMFSLEMTDHEVMEKLISIRSGVPSMKIMTGSLEDFEYQKVIESADSLLHGNLEIVTGITDLHKIVAIIRAHVMRRKIRFVIIDYVQLMTLKSETQRWEQLMEITKTLKNQVCKPLGVTCLAISQLKRSNLNSDTPDVNEQAGAYGMIADSDAALGVKKIDPSETKDGSNFLIVVGKNRFGWDEIKIPSVFDRVTQRISEI